MNGISFPVRDEASLSFFLSERNEARLPILVNSFHLYFVFKKECSQVSVLDVRIVLPFRRRRVNPTCIVTCVGTNEARQQQQRQRRVWSQSLQYFQWTNSSVSSSNPPLGQQIAFEQDNEKKVRNRVLLQQVSRKLAVKMIHRNRNQLLHNYIITMSHFQALFRLNKHHFLSRFKSRTFYKRTCTL